MVHHIDLPLRLLSFNDLLIIEEVVFIYLIHLFIFDSLSSAGVAERSDVLPPVRVTSASRALTLHHTHKPWWNSSVTARH